MKINEYDRRLGLEGRQFPGRDDKRVLEGRHEGPTLEIQDPKRGAASSGDDSRSSTRHLGGIVGRAHETGFGLKELGDLALVPEMIPGGDDINPGREDLRRGGGCDAGASGGVLTVGHDVVEP